MAHNEVLFWEKESDPGWTKPVKCQDYIALLEKELVYIYEARAYPVELKKLSKEELWRFLHQRHAPEQPSSTD